MFVAGTVYTSIDKLCCSHSFGFGRASLRRRCAPTCQGGDFMQCAHMPLQLLHARCLAAHVHIMLSVCRSCCYCRKQEDTVSIATAATAVGWCQCTHVYVRCPTHQGLLGFWGGLRRGLRSPGIPAGLTLNRKNALRPRTHPTSWRAKAGVRMLVRLCSWGCIYLRSGTRGFAAPLAILFSLSEWVRGVLACCLGDTMPTQSRPAFLLWLEQK